MSDFGVYAISFLIVFIGLAVSISGLQKLIQSIRPVLSERRFVLDNYDAQDPEDAADADAGDEKAKARKADEIRKLNYYYTVLSKRRTTPSLLRIFALSSLVFLILTIALALWVYCFPQQYVVRVTAQGLRQPVADLELLDANRFMVDQFVRGAFFDVVEIWGSPWTAFIVNPDSVAARIVFVVYRAFLSIFWAGYFFALIARASGSWRDWNEESRQ